MMYQAVYETWYFFGAFGAPFVPPEHARLAATLSPAGVTCVLVADLLSRVPDEFGERYYFFQAEPVQSERNIVADAVDTVGTPRLAAWLRIPIPRPSLRPGGLAFAAEGTDPPSAADDVESHSELRSLLTAFVEKHQDELEADLLRIGDRRQAKGFREAKARREAEQRDDVASQVYRLQDRLPELRNLSAMLAKSIDAQPQDVSTRRQARRLRGIISPIARSERDRFPANMRDWLAEVESLLSRTK
jgi:hypothetical protein